MADIETEIETSAAGTDDADRPLFQSQRQDEIAALAMRHGRVDVSAMATRFNVTTETIRRDLSELQSRKVLRRVHGGAVPWERLRFEPLLSVRGASQQGEKRRIGLLAAEEVPPSGSLLIDSGSTTARFCEALPRDRALTVVTNSILNAQVLADFEQIDVMMLGGKLRKNTMATVDAQAIAEVEQLTVDVLFISCDGMSIARGLTTPYRNEAMLKQAMIRSARKVIALVDHTKIDNDQLLKFADWSAIDVLITDTGVDESMLRSLESVVPTVRTA
ncbi:MAG: DeoR/GlpR transcriptional regulator [Ilumatobacter sp.]|nr:DeoR/GlpR transcriptional regulator [Ilumatobacter sp.]